MRNQEEHILELLNKVMMDIYNDSTYKKDSKCNIIYNFLVSNEPHSYDTFFEKYDVFSRETIEEYKDMIILNLCTDFYIDVEYRICKQKKPFYNEELDVYLDIETRSTPRQIISYFKNNINKIEAQLIIDNYLNFIEKDEFYLKQSIHNIRNRNKVFKIMAMNPLAGLRYSNFEIIKTEIIRASVYDLYIDLVREQITEIYNKCFKNDTKVGTIEDYVSELIKPKTIPSFYHKLKWQIYDYFSFLYPDKNEVNYIMSYIISDVYEIMKITKDEKYQYIIDYMEEKNNKVKSVVDDFLENDSFSNDILKVFIKNIQKSNHEIIERRKQIEDLGFIEVLKRYNIYYDMENKSYQKIYTK
ncbi:MAG: hypothetical protein GX247_00815 [Mollicutes bacterium]|nr:hypothetical protein [Mollicutes bacterium]